MSRIFLTAPTTFHIAPSGGDFTSLGAACAALITGYDLGGQIVTLQLQSGSPQVVYSGPGLALAAPLVGQTGPGSLVITGDPANPSGALIAPSSGNGVALSGGASATLQNFAIDTSTADQDCIALGQSAYCRWGNMWFGNAGKDAANHVSLAFGANLTIMSAYTITGGGQCHIDCSDCSTVYFNTNGNPADAIAVTCQGAPTFSTAFMFCDGGYVNAQAVRCGGVAHGVTCQVENNGVVNTMSTGGPGGNNVGNPNYFCGDKSPIVKNGGWFV